MDQETLRDKIIRKIKANRISTTQVADCMDKSGVIAGIRPLNSGHFRVGPVFFVYTHNESNWDLHEQIQNPPEGCVVVVEAINCGERATLGSLVAKFLFLYRQIGALAVAGAVRDAPHLIKENWPIWCNGITPIGCFNRRNEDGPDPDLLTQLSQRYNGGIAVCDDSGVVVIPQALQDEGFLDKLDAIEQLEDTWFDCIDRKKWTTFDAVCLKRYRSEP